MGSGDGLATEESSVTVLRRLWFWCGLLFFRSSEKFLLGDFSNRSGCRVGDGCSLEGNIFLLAHKIVIDGWTGSSNHIRTSNVQPIAAGISVARNSHLLPFSFLFLGRLLVFRIMAALWENYFLHRINLCYYSIRVSQLKPFSSNCWVPD